jgi:hypothetical protein
VKKDSSTARQMRGVPLAVLAATALLGAANTPNAEAALAGSAGNTVVRNTITVNYSDAKGNAQGAVSASVDISVTTVAATPTILAFTPTAGSTDGTGAIQTYTARVRSNSNGPGAVSFGTADGTFTNIAAGTAPTVPGNIYLGSTIIDPSDPQKGTPLTIANGSPITLAVPNDNAAVNSTGGAGAFNDHIINGLAVNAIVYVTDGTTYYGPFTVTAVTDPAVGTSATAAPGSITLSNSSGAGISFTPQYGWQIVEAKDVTFTVTQGQVPIATAESTSTWVTTLTATMTGATAATSPVTTTAHMGKLAIAKYVRNVSNALATGSTPYTPPVNVNGARNTFYKGGVTAKPGEILEYLAVVHDSGTGDSTAVYATDLTPTYSTLVAGTSYGSSTAGQIFAHAAFNNVETDLSMNNSGGATNVAYGSSTGTTAGSTMTFNLGTGCSTTAGGKLQSTEEAYIIYQVKIN